MIISPYAFAPLALSCILFMFVWLFWGFSWLLFLLILTIVFLYRKMPRGQICVDEKAILSPCDGQILSIDSVKHEDMGECLQICIQNAVYNAGTLFAPSKLQIEEIKFRHGFFLDPEFKLNPALNERIFIIAKNSFARLAFRINAGLFDRNIKFDNKKSELALGEEIGFSINSNITLFLPKDTRLLVGVSDVLKAKSLLGYFS